MEQNLWVACSGMSNPDCALAMCFSYRDAMTRKACVFALRNAEKELLLLCGAKIMCEMNEVE